MPRKAYIIPKQVKTLKTPQLPIQKDTHLATTFLEEASAKVEGFYMKVKHLLSILEQLA